MRVYFLFLLTTPALNLISTCGASYQADTGGYSNRSMISKGECSNVVKAGGNGAPPRSVCKGVNEVSVKNVMPEKKSDAVSKGAPQRQKG